MLASWHLTTALHGVMIPATIAPEEGVESRPPPRVARLPVNPLRTVNQILVWRLDLCENSHNFGTGSSAPGVAAASG